METEKGHASHKLGLTEVTVANHHLQINREATLRLTVGPSPDPSVIAERRLVEIWVDGSLQARWDVKQLLETHPSYETIRNFTGPSQTSTSPNTRYIQISLPPTTDPKHTYQSNLVGDLQPVRLTFSDSRGLHTALRWLKDAGFIHQERQSAPWHGSQASNSQGLRTYPALPDELNPIAVSREQRSRRHTAALPPISRPSTSQLQVFQHPGDRRRTLGSGHTTPSQQQAAFRDPAAARLPSHTRPGSLRPTSRRTSTAGIPQDIAIPRIERGSQRSAAVPWSKSRNDGAIRPRRLPKTLAGTGAPGSVATHDDGKMERLISDSSATLGLSSPVVSQPPHRDMVQNGQRLSEHRPVSAAQNKRPLSTISGPENSKRRLLEYGEPDIVPSDLQQQPRLTFEGSLSLSVAMEASEVFAKLPLGPEAADDVDIGKNFTRITREIMDIFERNRG